MYANLNDYHLLVLVCPALLPTSPAAAAAAAALPAPVISLSDIYNTVCRGYLWV